MRRPLDPETRMTPASERRATRVLWGVTSDGHAYFHEATAETRGDAPPQSLQDALRRLAAQLDPQVAERDPVYERALALARAEAAKHGCLCSVVVSGRGKLMRVYVGVDIDRV